MKQADTRTVVRPTLTCLLLHNNVHFNVSVTSRDLQTSRLGLILAGEANVSVSSRSRPFTSRAHPWLLHCNCVTILYRFRCIRPYHLFTEM